MHGKQGLTRVAAGTPPAAAALLELPPLSRQRPTGPTRGPAKFDMSVAMDGGGADAAAISRPRSPNRDIRLIGRFLQRTSSTPRTNKRYSRGSSEHAVALKELLLSDGDEGQLDTGAAAAALIPVVAAAHRESRSTAPDAGHITQPQPQQIRERPAADEMPSATPQPQLQKKASLRDRLKAWQKPPQPLEIVTEELKPHFAYEPKHAAADFSRMVVSPLSPTQQRLPPPGQPIEDDTPPARHSSQRRSRNHDGDRKPRKSEEATRRHSKSGGLRHSYTLVEDPFQASNAAAHIPVSSSPVAWSPGVQPANQMEHQQPISPSQPLSDYELFIARAEAQDRERREQVLRSISQRSAAYSANRVKPDPHRQFAVAVPGSPSAERSDTSQQRSSSGGRYVLGDRSGQQQQRQQPPPGEKKPARKGHARQSSWAASYATDSSTVAENVLERRKSPPQAQPRRLPDLPVAPSQPAVYGVDEEYNTARECQPPPLRMLRRQASISQRIVEYIRPKAAARPAGTLVE